MKKILVPTDFSKTSITALETAFEIAKKAGASIFVLHVVEEATPDSYKITGEWRDDNWEDRLFTFKLLERAKAQLEKLVMDPRFSAVKLVGELRLGNPFHGMNTIIAEQKVDLVVMGTRGKTNLESMVIGTNTERVVRHSHCPILTVHKKPSSSDFKNIVYATAMSKDEEIFSRIVKRTQQLYDSTIHLVRINTPGDFQRDRVVKDYMNKFAKSLQLKNFTINVYNDVSEEEGILYFADSIDADLIAMATHGRTGFAHVLAGSIAEGVVSKAVRPVLTWVIKH
ncbi:MAG: universal stress protein [Cytophagales bacterium]|jgi:nucleotide-binding universal stress UspA family protein|nr:universal stress protein [Cytophagales bacterium]MCA6386824.1 universal stress protein [Cytophagales bacterium]MCA6390875.1 universal stress protein [Cytophagales bacterium]MCA6394008.1 universal stress protein [Cytophagales bacterium]MCA6397509.1 universal stress protein [Cytophagales bacterium]